MKRSPLLLSAAALILCSFKSDSPNSVTRQEAAIHQTMSPLSVLARTYPWTNTVTVGSTSFGYYPLTVGATFSYYTTFSPAVNNITALTLHHSSFTNVYTSGIYTITYTYTALSQSYSIHPAGTSATLNFSGTVTFEKKVTATGQVVANSTSPYTNTQTVESGTLPFEIA